eukprot:1153911-Pelagomonas_calceolata.AAC.6
MLAFAIREGLWPVPHANTIRIDTYKKRDLANPKSVQPTVWRPSSAGWRLRWKRLARKASPSPHRRHHASGSCRRSRA